ncbi:MAG TPA: isoprenylcysteine carboxylmethyltransferase family protein [Myxococcales bacterium]|jgi:methyltransferase|nr:isoprenylcysteine carboxylmethyltransferase family protein [Myxococcales bacterium]
MVTAYLVFLALFGVERIAELLLSRRNARIAFSRAGVESGATHFRAMAALHALFLPACAAEVILLRRPFPGTPGLLAAAVAVLAQGLRWWAISALGWRWNVRVIVVPGEAPVRRGPYRFLRHPNYLAVAAEMLCVPLVHGAWICALVFSALNAALLRVRIRAEERALGRPWEQAFENVPRFIPHG